MLFSPGDLPAGMQHLQAEPGQAHLDGGEAEHVLRVRGREAEDRHPRAVADLAHRYATALEAGDVDALLGLLTDDATWCMPPMPTWFQGHEALRAWLVRDPLSERWRHQTAQANGQLAVGCYIFDPASGRYLPGVIDVLTLEGDKIAAVTAFVFDDERDPAGIFATFALPPWLP